MSIRMIIHNVKNIDDFEFEIPTQKGLYALTGENGTGKSTGSEVKRKFHL